MIEVVCEYVSMPGTSGRLELVFGPGGTWSKLFADCQGFRGTTVLRDTENPRRYMTVDLWDSATTREQALSEHSDDYAELLTSIDQWLESRRELGTFRVLNRATVRRRPRPRRRTTSL